MKPKICKGINRAKGIDGCGELSENRKFGLCPSCLWEWATNNENGKIWKEKQFMPKVKSKLSTERKTKNKEVRESLKSIQRLIQEARVPFQKWIRIRDANKACISCGTTTAKIWHAGHYFKAELYSGLIFNRINVNKQCEKCNTYGGGNESGYRLGLVKKYGNNITRKFEESANHLRQYKFSRNELIEIKKKYQKLLNELK